MAENKFFDKINLEHYHRYVSGMIKRLSDNIDERIDEKFKNFIEDNVSDGEILDARDGERTLGDRLNKFDEKYSEVSSRLEHIEHKTKVYFEDFGAKGDGITDDTQSIQDCIIYCENNGLIADGRNKTYIVSDIMGDNQNYVDIATRTDYGLYITKAIKIQNAKFILKDGCPNYTAIITIYATDGLVELYNLEFDGNRANQTPHSGREDGGMHGVRGSGNRNTDIICDLIIDKCYFHHCASDGLCITTAHPRHQIIVRNCVFEENRRNGYTDNALSNTLTENCIFKNQGKYDGDENITGPFSGYHIEPDEYQEYSNKKILNCQSYNNQGSGYKIDLTKGGGLSNIEFIDCKTKDNGQYSYGLSCVVRNNTIGIDVKINNCNIPDTVSLSTNSVATKEGNINYVIDNCNTSRIQVLSPLQAVDLLKIANSNVFRLYIKESLISSLYLENCIFPSNAIKAVDIYDTSTIDTFLIKNCKFPVDNTTATLSIYNTDKLTIQDCYFNCNNSIRVYNSNLVYILNNVFNKRGSWNYFLYSKTINNLTYVNNIMNNRDDAGTNPSGSWNSYNDVINKVENNIDVSYANTSE